MEEKKEGLSRRSFLSNSAVGAIGLAAVGFSAGSLINPREAEAATPAIGLADFPLPTVDIDVEKVRQYGYYCYKKYGGCGLGSARALLAGILDAHGKATTPNYGRWQDVPLNLYAWCNGGGAGGWGTLCGAVAGSAGVLNLMGLHGTPNLVTKVFEWYTQQSFPLPNFDSYEGTPVFPSLFPSETTVQAPIDDEFVQGHAVTDSPLCHVSVSKWLAAANAKLGDVDSTGRGLKEDRCAKVTGDTAAYAAFLINEYRVNRNPAAWAKPAAMAGCFDCHDPAGNATLTNKRAQTKMDCLPCHTEPVSGRK